MRLEVKPHRVGWGTIAGYYIRDTDSGTGLMLDGEMMMFPTEAEAESWIEGFKYGLRAAKEEQR